MPSVHQSHHDAELCIGGQVAEIGAVVAVLGHIAVARIEIYARLNTVNLVCAVPVIHQILSFGVSRIDCPYGNAAAAVVSNKRVGRFAVIVLAVRADILIAKRGSAALSLLARPCKGTHRQGGDCHQQAEQGGQDTPAA